MKAVIIGTAAAAALALSPAAAMAGDKHDGKHKGKGKHASYQNHDSGKGHPHGMPPGQAKKMWRQGERLPVTYITQRYYVSEPARYRLAPAPYGYRYVRVDDQIYLAQTQTGLISSVVSALLQ